MATRVGDPFSILLCTAYVPPGAAVEYHDSIRLFIDSISVGPHQLLIVGGFNYPDMLVISKCLYGSL